MVLGLNYMVYVLDVCRNNVKLMFKFSLVQSLRNVEPEANMSDITTKSSNAKMVKEAASPCVQSTSLADTTPLKSMQSHQHKSKRKRTNMEKASAVGNDVNIRGDSDEEYEFDSEDEYNSVLDTPITRNNIQLKAHIDQLSLTKTHIEGDCYSLWCNCTILLLLLLILFHFY